MMRWLQALKSVFSTSAYAEGAALLDDGAVEVAITEALKDKKTIFPVHSADSHYLGLRPVNNQWFGEKYLEPSLAKLIYHFISAEFPDCDDFGRIAIGRMLEGAYAERMRYQPAWGEFRYYARNGKKHFAIIVVDSEKKVWLYEPQNDTWTDKFDDVVTPLEVRL